MDIEQTKDVLAFALSLGSTLGKTLSDGKISVAELPLFITPVFKLPAALEGIHEVPTELSHLDDAEKAELYAYIQQNFDVADADVQGAVLDGLKLASDLHSYVKKYFIK